jgi:hypothetical protein
LTVADSSDRGGKDFAILPSIADQERADRAAGKPPRLELMEDLGNWPKDSGGRLEAIAARWAAATSGPWCWWGNVTTREISLATVDRGKTFVLDFVRWGMRGAQPRVRVDHIMRPASDLVVKQVPYRGDIESIDHPDAIAIAAAPADVAFLLRVAKAAGELIEAVENAFPQCDGPHEPHGCYECYLHNESNTLIRNRDAAYRAALAGGGEP